MEKITDHAEITRKLNSYLGTNLTEEEAATTEGFRKIATALRTKQCNNADLNFLQIDLKALEQLARDKGCFDIIFCHLSPVIEDFLKKKTLQVTAENQYNPGDHLPDDHCDREQPVYQ